MLCKWRRDCVRGGVPREMIKTLALLALASAPLGAQAPPLSLRDAARLAIGRNKSIEASAAAGKAAESKIAEARSGFLPKVDYSESLTRSDNPVFVFSSLLTEHRFGDRNFLIGPLNRPDFLNNFQSLVTADQPLYDAGKTRHAVRSAQLARDMTAEDGRRARMEVIAGVVQSYCDALLSANQLEAANGALRSVEADLASADARRAAGMATDADVLSIRVHLAGVKEQQIRRQADLDVAQAALNDASGLPLDTAHLLTTALTPANFAGDSLAGYESSGLAERPEARQSKLGVSLAQNQNADARGGLLPEVRVHTAFEADRQRFYDRGGANWLASIELHWNLFNGFGDKARIDETESALLRSQAEAERADSAIRLQVRRAWADLRAAQERIEVAQAAVAEAEESLRITRNRYSSGLSTVTDLLRTETAVLEARSRRFAAIHDQRLAAAALEMAAGTLSVDSEVLD